MAKAEHMVSGTTPSGILMYPHFDVRDSYIYEGKPTEPVFTGTLIWDKAAQATPEYKKMMADIEGMKAKYYGARPVPSGFFDPFTKTEEAFTKDGKPKVGFSDIEGGVFAKFSSKFDISVFGPLMDVITDPEKIKAELYQGCKARFIYTAALRPDIKKGTILLHLEKVQKTGNGPRIGGGGGSGLAFDAVDIADVDPMSEG